VQQWKRVRTRFTSEQTEQIEKLSSSPAVRAFCAKILESLDEEQVSRIIAAFLYLRAKGGSEKDLLKYLAKFEPIDILNIGLNTLGGGISAFFKEEELRHLLLKAGMNKLLELAVSVFKKKISEY
jgi:hypothetical protein